MNDIANSQYQHLGSGTAIMMRKIGNVITQKTGRINGPK